LGFSSPGFAYVVADLQTGSWVPPSCVGPVLAFTPTGSGRPAALGLSFVVCRCKIVGAPTWIRNVVVNIGTGTTRRAAVANGAGMIGISGEWGVASGEQQKEGEGTAFFLLPDRWSLVAFLEPHPPVFAYVRE